MTRILSVDDVPEMLQLIGTLFELAGYEHLRTTNGNEALAVLRNESVDLLTQDIMRPDMDGWELYRLMKADESLRLIPVLFISTARQSKLAIELCSTYGDEYMTKPFEPRELLMRVTSILKRRGKHIPTEKERTAKYEQIRSRLKRESRMTEEQLDNLYKRVSDMLTQIV